MDLIIGFQHLKQLYSLKETTVLKHFLNPSREMVRKQTDLQCLNGVSKLPFKSDNKDYKKKVIKDF